MIRSWAGPIVAGLIASAVIWQGILVATPFALMAAATKKIGGDLAPNRFMFGRMATADNQPIVRPSPDLAYSTCVFDLSVGPVLIDVPPVPDRYWSVSIFDARTDVAAVRSDRDTGAKPARLALLKVGQSAPAGYEAVRLGYDRGIALTRILLASPDDYPAIDAIRRQSSCKVAG
jgi:hypothetical protein